MTRYIGNQYSSKSLRSIRKDHFYTSGSNRREQGKALQLPGAWSKLTFKSQYQHC